MIKITVKGLEDMVQRLQAEQANILRAQVKAHSQAASEGARLLKRGLSWRAGRSPKDKNYQNSPAGSLPYAHTMRLRDSIGYKVLARGTRVVSEMGSGANGWGVAYAKYLEGTDGNGIRPFLDYAAGPYNPETVKAYFNAFYTPLAGDK